MTEPTPSDTFVFTHPPLRAAVLDQSMAEAAAIPSLGGYDEEFVNAVEEDFLCPICQLPLKEAIQTSVCGHRFCRQCLDGHFMRLAYRLHLCLS